MCRATSARSTPERASPRPADDAPRRDTAAVITVGVDLAAEAAGTAVAVIAWDDARAQVTALVPDATDADVVAAARLADKVGVDCPFGWPTGFVRLVGEHERGLLAPPASSGRDWRRSLTMRVTDGHVHALTGLTPLSVSADRIGHAALRWAAIAATLGAAGLDVRRDGSGLLAEVYPSAALRHWQLPHRGYKGSANREVRELPRRQPPRGGALARPGAAGGAVPDLRPRPGRGPVRRHRACGGPPRDGSGGPASTGRRGGGLDPCADGSPGGARRIAVRWVPAEWPSDPPARPGSRPPRPPAVPGSTGSGPTLGR